MIAARNLSRLISQSKSLRGQWRAPYIPRYPVVLKNYGFANKSRESSNRFLSELGFIILRYAVRLTGRYVGALYHSGKISRKTVAIIAGTPVFIYLGMMAIGGEVIPYSNRFHLVLLSHQDEQELAEEASREILAKEDKFLLPDSSDLRIKAQRIADDLLSICKADGVFPRDFKFKVHIIDAKIPNAFVLPDGTIFVYTGLLPLARTEAGLACVLGHEISHVLARHSAEKIGILKMLILVYEFLSGLTDYARTGKEILLHFLVVTVFSIGLPNAHSRAMESEADRVGLLLAARAGYDPRHVVELWKAMMSLQKHSKSVDAQDSTDHNVKQLNETTPSSAMISSADDRSAAPPLTIVARAKELLSTHPCHERRIRDLEKYAEELLPEYNAALDRRSWEVSGAPRKNTSNHLLIKTEKPPDRAWEDEFWGSDGMDAETWEHAALAQRMASLMVGSTGVRIEEFLRSIGRDDVPWGHA